MLANSIGKFSTTATGLASAAPSKAHLPVSQARGFVDMAVLQALWKSPWAPVISNSFRIQPPGLCVDNSKAMHEDALAGLVRKGLMTPIDSEGREPGAITRHAMRLGIKAPPPPDYQSIENPTVEDIVRVSRDHPCIMTMAHSAEGPSFSVGGYNGHHAVLLLGTYQENGRTMGIVVDGNDLQRSGIMDRVEAYAAKYHGGDTSKLSQGDFAAIQQDLKSARENGHVEQIVYKAIDLEATVSRADAAYRAYAAGMNEDQTSLLALPEITQKNSITWAENFTIATGQQPFITEEIAKELTQQGEL